MHFITEILHYLLPALFPSWRFFDAIGPAPKVEYAMLAADTEPHWQEYKPRPSAVGAAAMLARLWWNPAWNERLFVVRCAERLMQGERGALELTIMRRLQNYLREHHSLTNSRQWRLMFRVVATVREPDSLREYVVFESSAHYIAA